MSLLEKINSPSDLKQLKINELAQLAEEIRALIIKVSETNGGHLASSLGAVDIIVALYYVFDFPKDKLIFDVGHQSYAHKILSERKDLFDTIRKEGGLSGFPNIFESKYDAFTVGHAGTSISAGLGYAEARDALKQDYFVITFVGDGSMFNGENFEALFALEQKPQKFLIIANDNGMSISKNSNSLYKVASKISMKRRYSKFMDGMNKIFGWNFFGRWLKKIKASFKRSIGGSFSILDNVGIKYVGPFDGNNLKLLVQLFESFKNSPRTTLLHLKTKKGKGFEPAEQHSEFFHGVSKDFKPSNNTFSQAVGDYAIKLAEKDDKIVVVTAGMTYGTGMAEFEKTFPKRYYDVGISEEFAVTFSAGMAIAGLKPFVCIYSTFLQRSYDQIMIDVCLQNLPVIFLIDRAGFVGVDGATHQGLYDLSYLRHIPQMTILSPKDAIELKDCIDYALKLNSPVAIRYPNGINEAFESHVSIDNENLWETVKLVDENAPYVLCVGARALKVAVEASALVEFNIVNARTVKPLDEKILDKISNNRIITIEDNTIIGGFGSAVLEYYAQKGVKFDVEMLGANDEFVDHASVASQMSKSGITAENLVKKLKR